MADPLSALRDQVQQQLKYIQNQRRQLEDLRGRLERCEQLFQYAIFQPQIQWLLQNRAERMDPTVPIFDPGRATFHLDRYQFAAAHVRDRSVADIACGTGYGSRVLRQQGAATEVWGIDICPEAIDYALARHAVEGVHFRQAPGEATGLPAATFQAVVSFETIEHVPDDRALLKEFARILVPGGLLICSTPNQWPLEIAPHHVREYNREQFQSVLEPDFEVLEMHNQNSGTTFQFNRDQPRGIVPTTRENEHLAECFLAVCRTR